MRKWGMSVLILHITCPDHSVAADLAEALLEQRLVACASIGAAVESRYRWKGVVEQAAEVLLELKTRPALAHEVEAVITALHPYDVPAILRIPADANTQYSAWVRAETGG